MSFRLLYKCVLCITLLTTLVTSSSNIRYKFDLAQKKDLNVFMEALNKVVNYYDVNRDNIHVDVLLGLFLINVNLGYTLKYKEKRLPTTIQTMTANITTTSEKLMNYFLNRTKKEPETMPWQYTQIATLFVNVTNWINRLEPFQNINQKSYSQKELHEMFPDWPKYREDVNNAYDWNPNPEVSDMCLVSLAINANNKKNNLAWCPVSRTCYSMLQNGTDFGYALCHRILLLVMAHLGRGCYIFTPQDDEQMLQKFCSIGYAEVEYIALNDFKLADLMFEFMCMCSLDGQSQYLRRTWLNRVLNHQTADGCFGQSSSKPQIIDPWYIEQLKNRRQFERQCTGHITALASGVLSSAIRFIGEKYY